MSGYDKRLYELAKERGWVIPAAEGTKLDAETWNFYWRMMERSEQEKEAGNPDPGRPLPPHRTGR